MYITIKTNVYNKHTNSVTRKQDLVKIDMLVKRNGGSSPMPTQIQLGASGLSSPYPL